MRVGVVGAGYIGRCHVAAWRRLGFVPHVHSRSAERRAEMVERHGARPHEHLGSLLGAVDVVDVCTPTDTHAAITCAAAAAGRHVICEKPLARTLGSAAAMIDACRTARVGLYPAHVVRYYSAYVAARSVATSDRYGAPVALRFRRAGAVPGWAGWLHEHDRSGGILCDFMIHDLDAARWIAGEVAEVSACTTRTGSGDAGAQVEARVVVRHSSGAVSHVSGSWGPPGAVFRTGFEVAMRSGVVWHDSLDGGHLRYAGTPPDTAEPNAGTADPMTTQLAEFRDAIAGGPAPRVTAEDGYAALALSLAAVESAETGRPVTPSG